MKKILLDTNAYSNYLRGDKSLIEVLSEADIVYMSIFVTGELFAGFKGGKKEKENKKILKKFLEKSTVKILEAGLETSEIFGEIKNKLKSSGNLIPINDVWIAAHAVETGSVLISFDKHFKKIEGLRSWNGE
jgi:tRNA(fMet)-specific endonuclease VapC